MSRFIDLTGVLFGRLLALGVIGKKGEGFVWACQCECGNFHRCAGGDLRAGKTRSCGCLHRENGRKTGLLRKHGACFTSEYSSWHAARDRTLNPKSKDWDGYGGRGISFAEEWHDFQVFLKDMGPKPGPEFSIERVDVNGNYEKGNCIWGTPEQQDNNRRTSVKHTLAGVTKTVAQWAREFGVSRQSLHGWLDRGNRLEDYRNDHA